MSFPDPVSYRKKGAPNSKKVAKNRLQTT